MNVRAGNFTNLKAVRRCFKLAFQNLFLLYGIFLIPAIIAERRNLFDSITRAIKAVREGSSEGSIKDMMKSDVHLMKKESYLKDGGYKTLNYFE